MSSQFSGGRLIDLIELLFQELRAFGLFSSQLSHRKAPSKARFEAYVTGRLSSFNQIIRGIDLAADTIVKHELMPILYNTSDWPQNAPIAGYAGPSSTIKFSNLLATYIGNWKYEHDNAVFYGRLLRVALYMWRSVGLQGAIDYLFDLERYGYFILPQGVEHIIYLLVKLHAKGSSADDIIAMAFNGKAPQTEQDWLEWDWKLGRGTSISDLGERHSAEIDNARVKKILEHIILTTISINERTRQLDNPVDWMLEQAYVFIRSRQVISLCESFQLEKTVMLKTILDQFEEIQADSGSIFLSDPGNHRFSAIQNPLVIHAAAFLAIFQANLGYEEGEARLFSERVIYPAVLREQMLHPKAERRLDVWGIVPPRLHYPFVASRGDGTFASISDQDLEKMSENIITAIQTEHIREKEKLLEDLLTSYPYFPAVHLELAIFYDEQGDLQRAWEHILTTLVLDLESPLAWQSLSVILSRFDNMDESRIAQAISQYLAQGGVE